MSRGTVLRGENNPHSDLLKEKNSAGNKILPKWKINTRKMIYFLKDFTNEKYTCLGCDEVLAFQYIFSKAQSTTGSRRSPNHDQQSKRSDLKCRRKVYCLECATRMNYISRDEVPKFFYEFNYDYRGRGDHR